MTTKIFPIFSLIMLLVSACAPIKLPSVKPVQIIFTSPTPEPEITSTPEPDPFSVETLKSRTYGAGNFTVDRLWYSYDLFDRYYVIYDSDGLIIHGFVNVPHGEGPFPVVIMLHGSVPRDEYQTLDYTTRYADDLAQDGYIVLHPNLRNFPPSSITERRRDSHTGYTIDVLNLLAHLRKMAGKEGIFETADIGRVGIWGHSIGGSIAMRAISVEPVAFTAAILYGAVSQRYATVVEGAGIFDFQDVKTKISIHHGESDEVISVEHSRTLCSQFQELGKDPECYFYEGQPHTFYRDQWADPLFMERSIEFFDRYLKDTL